MRSCGLEAQGGLNRKDTSVSKSSTCWLILSSTFHSFFSFAAVEGCADGDDYNDEPA